MGQPLHFDTCVCMATCIGLGVSDDKDRGSAGDSKDLHLSHQHCAMMFLRS